MAAPKYQQEITNSPYGRNNPMNPNDKARAATLLLAALDDDQTRMTAVLDDAHDEPGGLPGLLAALVVATMELLVGTIGEDGARKTLNMTLLDAQLDGGPTDA